LAPEVTPLTFHTYEGVDPPLVGVAVNVTEVPAQTGFADAAIATLTGRTLLTVTFKMVGVAVVQPKEFV